MYMHILEFYHQVDLQNYTSAYDHYCTMTMTVNGASLGALFLLRNEIATLLPSICLRQMLAIANSLMKSWPHIIIHHFLRKES